MRVLHGASASPFVRKVRVALAEKGASIIRSTRSSLFDVSDEYKKMSPLGKIPCYTPRMASTFRTPRSSSRTRDEPSRRSPCTRKTPRSSRVRSSSRSTATPRSSSRSPHHSSSGSSRRCSSTRKTDETAIKNALEVPGAAALCVARRADR